MNKREELLLRQQAIKERMQTILPPEPVAKPKPISKKGKSTRVDPITDLKKIEAIKWLLRDKPRDLALFTVGINTNLRASDLSRITVGQVRNLKPMEEIVLKEKKTGKLRRISMNSACTKAIGNYLKTVSLPDDYRIFGMTTRHMGRLVKNWCDGVNCKGSFSSHSLRKTACYHQYRTFNRPLPDIMTSLNHSSERQTLAYLSIQPENLKALYMNEL